MFQPKPKFLRALTPSQRKALARHPASRRAMPREAPQPETPNFSKPTAT